MTKWLFWEGILRMPGYAHHNMAVQFVVYGRILIIFVPNLNAFRLIDR